MNQINIIPYTPEYKDDFRTLNEEWITQYFVMEPADYEILENPEKFILADGGKIFMAVNNKGEAVGTCALIKMNDNPFYEYELAKLGVSPAYQGLKIGLRLCQAVIDEAKSLGCRLLYIESNSNLTPALNLYEKLGFIPAQRFKSGFERGNVQLELKIK